MCPVGEHSWLAELLYTGDFSQGLVLQEATLIGSWPLLMLQLDQEPWPVYFLIKVLLSENLRHPGHNVPIFLACLVGACMFSLAYPGYVMIC